jgi:2-amino-4-hydroxy-6-hydroxymethyldihydropteridine diphosphokinase
MVGRALYCADFLEPGRDFAREERRELAERFPEEPRIVLCEIARWRISYTVESGWALLDPTVRFWNALASSSAPER